MSTPVRPDNRHVYLIPEGNLKKFEHEIAKLSRRAVRLGGEEIVPVVYGVQEIKDKAGTRVFYEVLFDAEPLKINGWTFAATLDHANETGNIVRVTPNLCEALPESYRTSEPICEHCKVRRYRRDTYVLRGEAGGWMQIGRSCLKDFFGHDPLKTARMAEMLGYADEIARCYEEERTSVGRDYRWLSLDTFATCAATAIRLYGWVSAAEVKNSVDETLTSTRSMALDGVVKSGFHAELQTLCEPEDERMAEDAIAWARSFREKNTKSDWEHNVCVIAEAGVIEMRSTGLAASIVGVFAKQQKREQERLIEQQQPAIIPDADVHVGEVKQRLRGQSVILLSQTHREADGVRIAMNLYRFKRTEDGAVLIWYASENHKLVDGEALLLDGTVKRHGEYNGLKNTTLTRCKAVRPTEGAPA